MIKFRCPNCEKKLGVPDEYAGRRVRCNQCSQPCRVPQPKVREPKMITADAIVEEEEKASAPATPRNPVPRPPTTPDEDDMEIDRNAEILRQARSQKQSRQKGMSVSSRVRGSSSEGASGSRHAYSSDHSNGGFSIKEYIPGFLVLPLSLVLCIGFMAAMIGLWIFCASRADMPLNFFLLLIPLAGALGMRLPATNHTFLMGLLALLLGAGGIALGMAAMAKYYRIPHLEAISQREVLVDLDAVLANKRLQMKSGQSASSYAKDGIYMMITALISCVEDGTADPYQVREYAVQTLVETKEENMIDYIESRAFGSGVPHASDEEVNEEEERMLAGAFPKLMEWEEQDINVRMVRKYYPALRLLTEQANIIRDARDPDTQLQEAFIAGFGLLDLMWIMLGSCGAYVIASVD